VKHKETFGTVKEVFGEDRVYPQRKPPAKREPLMSHDHPFKPANPPKKGYNKTIDKFPEYKEDPLKFAMRRKTSPDEEAKPNFKLTYNGKTVPTPSVTTHFKNLRSEFPSIFKKF
jgi:hypothetical protein